MRGYSKIYWFEAIIFIFFGVFHLHRIWAFIDRQSYSDYWITLLVSKNIFYYVLMGVLFLLCLLGLIVFFKNIKHNFWWRWIYFFGGGYVIFDLSSILFGITWWNDVLLFMFDTSNTLWNVIWGTFIAIGFISMTLAIYIIKYKRKLTKTMMYVNLQSHKYYIRFLRG